MKELPQISITSTSPFSKPAFGPTASRSEIFVYRDGGCQENGYGLYPAGMDKRRIRFREQAMAG